METCSYTSPPTRIGDYPSGPLTSVRLCHAANPRLRAVDGKGGCLYLAEIDAMCQSLRKTRRLKPIRSRRAACLIHDSIVSQIMQEIVLLIPEKFCPLYSISKIFSYVT